MIKAINKKSPKAYPWIAKYPEGIDWDIKIPEGSLNECLEKTVAKYPGRCAISFLGKTYTYQELSNLINQTATGLQQKGIRDGMRVGLILPNNPSYIIFYYALLKIGVTVVNYSPLYAVQEIIAQINDSKTDIMVTLNLEILYSKVYSAMQKSCLKKIIICNLQTFLTPIKKILFNLFKTKEIAKINWDKNHIKYEDLINNTGIMSLVEIDPKTQIAVIQYTGGTTGTPKGAMLSHQNLYANVTQARIWFLASTTEQEKVLAALPFFHVFAMTAIMNLSVAIGAKIVMVFPKFNVQDAIKMIDKHKITFFPAVPTIFNMINNHIDLKKYDLSSLRVCLSGGAPLPIEVKKSFEDLSTCKLVEAYGLSETSPGVTSNPIDGVGKPGSIGIPVPGTTIKIMSLEDPSKEVDIGKKGEICISGPQVMLGYWNRKQETDDNLKNGLFYTGDVGYMDQEGYIFLVDRIKDLIICNGYNVYPRNVEEAIYLNKFIEEVTVIGVPDDKKGEAVKAFIKLKESCKLSAQEVQTFLKDKLSPIEIPKLIEFRNELPKTMIGKLSKKELKLEEQKKVKTLNK